MCGRAVSRRPGFLPGLRFVGGGGGDDWAGHFDFGVEFGIEVILEVGEICL